MGTLRMHADSIRIIDPAKHSPAYAEELYQLRQRKGLTRLEADAMAKSHTVFGSLMLRRGRPMR
jgi:phosphotransacetylase